MTTAYSTLMGLAEPVQGELSGTWGDTVNKGITEYLDIALAGTQTISGSQTAVTLSLTNGNASATNIAQAGSGATGSAQYALINCTGNPAGLLTITAPASSRQYIVINATSTSQSVKIVGTGPTTGVTIVSGEKAIVAWNGTDYVKVSSSLGTGDVVGPASATDSALVAFDGTTGKLIKQASTVTVAQGGTGQTSYTDGQLLIGNSSGNTLTKATLTPGSGISITNGNGSISIASTASVSAATPTALGTVYGSMTTAGASPYLTALGYSAGNAATGIYNTFVGYQAGVVTSTGYRNTAIGANALAANTSGRYNTAIGDSALPANTTSHYSTAVGYQAGLVNTQPALVAIGAQALAANTSGDSNTACGYAALNANITGNYNTGIGREALTLSTGTNNTALGYLAGSSITSGSNNIVIGSSAAASSATVSNETTIGSSSTTSFRAFGDLKLQRDYTEKVVTANTGTAYTIDITNGTVQILTLTGNCTFTFPTATAGKSFMFLLKQDATGSRTVTWPAAVKWPGGTAPTITATASKLDKYVFTADGTNWIGSNAGQNYL